jgi:hypothetical protein
MMMVSCMSSSESALVVLVPEAEAVVKPFRDQPVGGLSETKTYRCTPRGVAMGFADAQLILRASP